MESHHRYISRTDALIIERMDDELLVYDERSDNAHSLTPSATAVYDACRGGATLRVGPRHCGPRTTLSPRL